MTARLVRAGLGRLALVWAVAAISACAEPALRPEQVTGSWDKDGDTLPPINLLLWIERDTLRARLRLSGSESMGTAALEGRELRVRFADRAQPLVGELVSPAELVLRMGARSYRLRKGS